MWRTVFDLKSETFKKEMSHKEIRVQSFTTQYFEVCQKFYSDTALYDMIEVQFGEIKSFYISWMQ